MLLSHVLYKIYTVPYIVCVCVCVCVCVLTLGGSNVLIYSSLALNPRLSICVNHLTSEIHHCKARRKEGKKRKKERKKERKQEGRKQI